MLKGFKEFITRGNVVELAVAFVMGAAFAALIQQFTASFLNPLIRVILGGGGAAGSFTVRGQRFDYGAFINALITFVLTAAVVYYFVVLPMNAMIRRRGGRLEAEPTDEVRLLTEIRDRLPGRL